jgi:hypothetical protein
MGNKFDLKVLYTGSICLRDSMKKGGYTAADRKK